MENKTIVADTSVLIDFFRKTNKENSIWIKLFDEGYDIVISSVTHYEIYSGATAEQIPFWKNILQQVSVITFDAIAAQSAVTINNMLKRKRKQIDMADLFIAATAISNELPLATLNQKHFERIDGLSLITI